MKYPCSQIYPLTLKFPQFKYLLVAFKTLRSKHLNNKSYPCIKRLIYFLLRFHPIKLHKTLFLILSFNTIIKQQFVILIFYPAWIFMWQYLLLSVFHSPKISVTITLSTDFPDLNTRRKMQQLWWFRYD